MQGLKYTRSDIELRLLCGDGRLNGRLNGLLHGFRHGGRGCAWSIHGTVEIGMIDGRVSGGGSVEVAGRPLGQRMGGGCQGGGSADGWASEKSRCLLKVAADKPNFPGSIALTWQQDISEGRRHAVIRSNFNRELSTVRCGSRSLEDSAFTSRLNQPSECR